MTSAASPARTVSSLPLACMPEPASEMQLRAGVPRCKCVSVVSSPEVLAHRCDAHTGMGGEWPGTRLVIACACGACPRSVAFPSEVFGVPLSPFRPAQTPPPSAPCRADTTPGLHGLESIQPSPYKSVCVRARKLPDALVVWLNDKILMHVHFCFRSLCRDRTATRTSGPRRMPGQSVAPTASPRPDCFASTWI